jgi:pyruvate ferredoxin oxidoreductase gamma subunit
MKTAARILGSACFHAGFEVQDAPRYGAERRGAPVFAYVRAAAGPIAERGVIARPDLVVVADQTLVPIAGAGVSAGVDAHTVLLINSEETAVTWRTRLNLSGPVLSFRAGGAAEDRSELPFVGASCAGAAARLLGVVSVADLEQALRQELAGLGTEVIERNLDLAGRAFAQMAEHAGCVAQGEEVPARGYRAPAWIELPFDDARVAAPVIRGAATSELVKTGLWRTLRPVIDYERCNRCWWVCSSLCPDGAIRVLDGRPEIDYEHCKGCLVCMAQCPTHAISAVPEHALEASTS